MRNFIERSTGLQYRVIESPGRGPWLDLFLRDSRNELRASVYLLWDGLKAELSFSFPSEAGRPGPPSDLAALWLLAALACERALQERVCRFTVRASTQAVGTFRRIGMHHPPGHLLSQRAFRALHSSARPGVVPPPMWIRHARHPERKALNPEWLRRFELLYTTSTSSGTLTGGLSDLREALLLHLHEDWIEVDRGAVSHLPLKKRPYPWP